MFTNNILGFITIIAAILLSVCSIFTSYSLSIIKGDSMHPLISDGDVIILEKSKTYEVGDIVIFVIDNRTLIKKVIEKKNDDYFVLGMQTNSFDSRIYGTIKNKQIIGKYYAKIFNFHL